MATALPQTPGLLRLSSTPITPLAYFSDGASSNADVVLIVEEKRFYCHRLLLSLVSPVFQRMFDGQFREHTEKEIVLEGKKSKSILDLLLYIYPQFESKITNDNLEDFILLADEYMIDYLKQPLKAAIVEQLEQYKFVELPMKQKLVQPSLTSKSFHSSDSEINRHDGEHHHASAGAGRHLQSARGQRDAKVSNASTSRLDSKHGQQGATAQTPRFVLFYDQSLTPKYYDARHVQVQFGESEFDLWLRRLRILYQVDKGRSYDEVVNMIISVLQYVPATLLHPRIRMVLPTDRELLSDLTRARLHFLEELVCDGEQRRPCQLAAHFSAFSPTTLAAHTQDGDDLATPNPALRVNNPLFSGASDIVDHAMAPTQNRRLSAANIERNNILPLPAE